MDELDQRIITYFEDNGFHKSTALAPAFGVRERTMRRRITNLIKNNLVKIIAVPNIGSLGFKAWARIGIRVTLGSLSHVASVLVTHDSVNFVTYALGRFDIIISVFFDTTDKLTYFVNSELTGVEGILSTETMLLVSLRKYELFSWPAPALQETKSESEPYRDATFSHSHYEVDELDRRILNILKTDGLTRPASLESSLGIGRNTIRKHMKAMLQNEVYKVQVVPIVDALAYEVEATIGINTDQQFPHKIIDSIIEHPGVFLASVCLGRFNLVIGVRLRNIDLLNQFITEVLPSIPGISFTETYLHTKRLKYYSMIWSTS